MAEVLKEVWTGELVKKLHGGLEGTWLDGIADYSSLVDNDVIHLVEVGVDPDVLVNNKDYPIGLQALDDKDIALQLDKFQTKVTPVTDDELYALSYDKMARVIESHAWALTQAKLKKAAENVCMGARTVPTASGEATIDSILSMKRSLDAINVPMEGRRLVLCSRHVNDLLGSSQLFKEQYGIDRANGVVARLFGFDIYEYWDTPKGSIEPVGGPGSNIGMFTLSDDAAPVSFAFYAPRLFKCEGEAKMYYSAADTDPEYQRNKVNFRQMFLARPKMRDCAVVLAVSNIIEG